MSNIFFIGGSGYLGNYISSLIRKECFNLRSWQLKKNMKNNSCLLYLSCEPNPKNFEKISNSILEESKKKLQFYCKKKIHLIYFSSVIVLQESDTKYSQFKYECEKICADYGQTIIRLSSVFGGEYDREIITNDICKIINKQKNKLLYPNSYANICSAERLSQAVIKIMKKPKDNMIFNLCMQNSIKSSDLLALSLKLKEKKYNPQELYNKKDHSKKFFCDTSSAEDKILWDPKLPIDELSLHLSNYPNENRTYTN